MPKFVDHAARRAELSRAMWRVVADRGLAAATVRAVAAESGWSMGAVRHYFKSQDELLLFGMGSMVEVVQTRVVRLLSSHPPSPLRARLLLEELLPMDVTRLSEVRVYLAFMGRARVDASWEQLRAEAFEGERHLCRWAIADVTGCAPPQVPGQSLPDPAEVHVDTLQAVVDGLSVIGATVPEQMGADRMRTVLSRHLERLTCPSCG